MENKSEADQRRELEARIKELEATLRSKEFEFEILSKIIELADKEYKTDLKKNLSRLLRKGKGSKKGGATNTK